MFLNAAGVLIALNLHNIEKIKDIINLRSMYWLEEGYLIGLE